MASTLESSDSATQAAKTPSEGSNRPEPPGWLKVGAIAAASALAGGLAAAWFYRKTLTKLREAENGVPTREVRTSEADLEVDE